LFLIIKRKSISNFIKNNKYFVAVVTLYFNITSELYLSENNWKLKLTIFCHTHENSLILVFSQVLF